MHNEVRLLRHASGGEERKETNNDLGVVISELCANFSNGLAKLGHERIELARHGRRLAVDAARGLAGARAGDDARLALQLRDAGLEELDQFRSFQVRHLKVFFSSVFGA